MNGTSRVGEPAPGAFDRVELREIDLNITNRCNLRCLHCAFASGSGDTTELPYGVIERIVADARAMGCEDLHLTGGEPTLHREFERVLDLILSSGLFTRLISNGVLARDRLPRYHALGLRHVLFSLDGLATTHDRIRGADGAFAVTIARVRQALELGYDVRVNAVAMRGNLEEITALYDHCAAMGVQTFSVFLYSPTGRNASKQLDLTVDALAWRSVKRALAERCQGKATEVFVEKGFRFPDEPEPLPEAMAGRGAGCHHLASVLDYVLITGDGNVFPCALLNDKGIPYGNVLEQRLPDIVAHPGRHFATYRGFREPAAGCTRCPAMDTCHGGCRAFAHAFTASWGEADPRCGKGIADRTPPFVPLCPLFKENLNRRRAGGFSERVSRPD